LQQRKIITMHTASNLFEIPLNKLFVWEGNVRKTGIESGLDELAASIAAHDLINPLVVRKAPKGRYAIIAGQRRFLALKRLAAAGTLERNAPVSCAVRTGNDDDSEISLAENVVRVAMHPADQFEAWRGLIDKGAGVPEIAARFGVAESTVKKRLALARVSPRIFALYRAEEIDLETLQAFTVTDDHALQESVWQNLPGYQRDNPRAIRQALTEGEVSATDRRVRFVGLDAYEAAGGAVRRDLFDADNGGYVSDIALLDALVLRRLETVAEDVRAEGWKWIEARPSFGWNEQQDFTQGDPVDVPLPDDIEAEADSLRTEYDELCDSDDSEAGARQEAIGRRLDEIDAMARVWPDELKACAGAVVSLSHAGGAEIERGLIREEDAAEQSGDDSESGDMQEPGAETERSPYPASLIADLSAQRTAALRIATARSPDIALALVVHAIACNAFYASGDRVLKLRLTHLGLFNVMQDHDAAPAVIALEAERDRVRAMLPEDQSGLWDWCLTAERETLLDVLAVSIAFGIDAVEGRNDPNRGGVTHGKALAAALGLDIVDWYRPTAAGYFGRIGKAAIMADLESMRQAPPAPAWLKLKKAELATLAEREAAQRPWLPVPLQ
jgi:ParB family transcriptional regulator, chromosome partitioning protein